MNDTITSPSDGSVGVAPRTGLSTLRLLIEGWRFLPHSYCLFSQSQCLELLRRQNVALSFLDAPPLRQLGQPVRGLLPEDDERDLGAMPRPEPGAALDAVYRIGYPYDFGPSCAKRTFVFATCERKCVRDTEWRSHGRKVGDVVAKSRITVITPSAWSRDGFIRAGIAPERIKIVPHGIDPAVFRPADPAQRQSERKQLGWDDKFTFLNVSALTGNKNVNGIMRAFAGIVRRHSHARLMLKGLSGIHMSDHWVRCELARLSRGEREIVARNMIYTGEAMSTADLAQLYQRSDAYVSPYQSEGFNIPVLEAAACGLPVLVTGGGSTDDFTNPDFAVRIPSRESDFDHDGSRWLKTDVADIESAMERAITDSVFRAEAAVAGPFHAHGLYSWPRVVDRLLSVLTSEGNDR